MPNIRIKLYPGGQPATSKFQIMDPSTEIDGIAVREKGYRHLEPGEIVEIDAKMAKHLLEVRGEYLELTLEDPTRPLFLGDIGTARMTSQTFNTNTDEKVKDQKQARARVADMVKPKAKARKAKDETVEATEDQ